MSVAPRDASTVLPVRDGPLGLEVFMIKRSSRLGFLGGAHVFPGGAVDAEDSSQAVECHAKGFDAAAAAAALGVTSGPRARGHYVAAIRELFEEAGVLLARSADGSLYGAGGASGLALSRHRAGLADGSIDFCSVLEALGAKLATETLSYFAHWITPASEPKRFDTRFFLTVMPPGQEAAHDAVESTHGEWLRPADALARYARGTMPMVFPTICCLDRLALHADADDALRACKALDVVDVVPKIVALDERVLVLYPGDPGYEAPRGLSEPGRILDRRVSRDGRWVKP